MVHSSPPSVAIPVLRDCSAEHFRSSVQSLRRPCIIRGAFVGPCVDLWKDLSYLERQTENKYVRAHVAPDPLHLDFKNKTFKYISMPFHELLRRAKGTEEAKKAYKPFLAKGEGYYLRDVGSIDPKPRKGFQRACFYRDYPELAKDVSLASWYDNNCYFSSVLRVTSPGLRLFTHYDTTHNIYLQVVGSKKITLWAPEEALNLYLQGDKSKVVDIESPDLSLFPLFPKAERHEGCLLPGDLLFVPSLWFHNTFSEEFSIAVNVFWRELPPSLYDINDLYGNRDLLPARKAMDMLNRILKQIEILPRDQRDFYGRLMINEIGTKCLSKPLLSVLLNNRKPEETPREAIEEELKETHGNEEQSKTTELGDGRRREE